MFSRIANYFARHNMVRKVAENPAIAAELLLLTKIVFADRECSQSETEAFANIAEKKFGIEREALPDVLNYIKDFGYETSTGQAAALFAELAPESRVSLVESLLEIAAADNEVDSREVEMIERVAAILGIPATQIEDLRAYCQVM